MKIGKGNPKREEESSIETIYNPCWSKKKKIVNNIFKDYWSYLYLGIDKYWHISSVERNNWP